MDIYVARQPIFDLNEKTVAYELLYRSSAVNTYQHTDGDQATTDVIVNSFLNIGVKDLSNGKPCFINFTDNLLKLGVPSYFNPLSIVVEILETVELNDEILKICQELKSHGYTIALDDFFVSQWNELTVRLLDFIDIIKIDFRTTSRTDRQEMIRFLKGRDIRFLAEKVETIDEYLEAKEDGFVFFQGFYFSKPVILNSYDIPSYYHSYFQILKETESPEPDLEKIKDVIEKDISLSYKLLRLINNPVFRPRNEISSIKQAIILLGLNEIKKWIYVLAIRGAVTGTGNSKEREIIELSLKRGKLGELIGRKVGREVLASKYFLLGMFSLMDSLLHHPMEDLLQDLPLSNELKDALSGEKNDEYVMLQFLIDIEHAFHENLELAFNPTTMSKEELFRLYGEASDWAAKVLTEVNP
ncbi:MULTISPECIES: HDOD domain-containing protein [Bacillaceae]|jgi:c-di-GMP-related signal transduction protein|uniref:EAL and HDOD domain-containing protein n=1 Tax=Bacillaceae TaxID=186817 RepID=UPI00119D1EB1|nr:MULTISPECIES: HDOD domain-containing protein [Bacillaceae]MCM3124076.1 HDOD domain-containing protein [Mesobacillus sp. MER 33]MCM3233925.1 HDOD domain-containing protein [Mesobacillus sp. MER 48]